MAYSSVVHILDSHHYSGPERHFTHKHTLLP